MKINLKTKSMNTLAKGFVFVLGVSLFTGCTEENVLELEPYNQVSEDAAFTTPALIELSVTGMYNAAQVGYYLGTGARGYPFGAAAIQQGDNRGEDVVNTQTFYQLTYTGTYDPSTANNVYLWSDTYRLINRTNIVIEGVTNAIAAGVISEEIGGDYVAQAKFMRAISHLELISHFGNPYQSAGANTNLGIPYREIPYTTEANIELGLAQGRNTVHEVYTKIIADLDDAEAGLFTKAERGDASIIRATMEAAIAYKTRAYLHMREWQNVITEGEKILGSYSLTEDPNDVFANGYNNTESIFSMENTANNNPGVNGALGSQYNRRSLVVISPIVWRNEYWLPNDERRTEGNLVTTRSGVPHTNKYKDDVNYSDATPLMRYAEVLLNVSEAYARENNLTASLDLLNEVRDRSIPEGASSYTGFASQEDLLRAIIGERRIEFVMEGKRWQDLHRLQFDTFVDYDGIPAKVENGYPPVTAYTLGTPYTGPYGVEAIPYSDYRFLWPIPQQEMNNNPNIEQNPGWD